jgi:hypothetical protein
MFAILLIASVAALTTASKILEEDHLRPAITLSMVDVINVSHFSQQQQPNIISMTHEMDIVK